ncbi:MAG: hypothetical protein GY804_05245 [Alphaproteobacteria bacterium]|nr:hypothetical protein [Alphaproteobacteria bacterium]
MKTGKRYPFNRNKNVAPSQKGCGKSKHPVNGFGKPSPQLLVNGDSRKRRLKAGEFNPQLSAVKSVEKTRKIQLESDAKDPALEICSGIEIVKVAADVASQCRNQAKKLKRVGVVAF